MKAYYNENDPYAAQWLRNLIAAGLLPAGDVDDRSIEDVRAGDLAGYRQQHFFAGIGGWPLALKLAGWGDQPVWTGSCPCQPFSVAGKKRGTADRRHLWPVWRELIHAVKPDTVFGEQVTGPTALDWYDNVASDLEEWGYETAAAILPACSVGAPHRRGRLFFVAHAASGKSGWIQQSGLEPDARAGCEALANTNGNRGQAKQKLALQERHASLDKCSGGNGAGEFWAVEPSIRRLVDGFPGRMVKLRALGNAIVPQLAAEFVKAFMDFKRK